MAGCLRAALVEKGERGHVDVVRTFGATVAQEAKTHPDRARKLLIAGWKAKRVQLSVLPDKRLPKSRQYASRLAMDIILDAMTHPENAAAVSIFTPSEPLEAAGIKPFSVEQISSFLAGSSCEGAFLSVAGQHGFCETMCSYHRTFLGALSSGIVPKPRFAVYTNLACDGNLITFPFLEQKLGIPGFCIDVPFERSEEAVADVARQIREMTEFVGDVTGKPVDEERLREAVARDARLKRLRLTEKARRIQAVAAGEFDDFEARATDGLTSEEIETLHALLTRIRMNLETKGS